MQFNDTAQDNLFLFKSKQIARRNWSFVLWTKQISMYVTSDPQIQFDCTVPQCPFINFF